MTSTHKSEKDKRCKSSELVREDFMGLNLGYDFVDHKWIGNQRDIGTVKCKLSLNTTKEVHIAEMEPLYRN